MRSEQEVNRAIEQYADTVRRVCLLYLKNPADTEDIFQEVFLKYALSTAVFENEAHEKAWILRVAINQCKDLLKSFFKSKTVPLEAIENLPADMPQESRAVLDAILRLPPKYKEVVYLHYYEGYSASEIGQMLHKNENTVYTLLSRARKMLKEKLGGEENGA